VIAEATCLIGSRLGARAEVKFLESLAALDVEAPVASDWARVAELTDRYRNFPLGGVDASVVALAERLACEIVITLDRRHFGAIRPKHCQAFRLLPAGR
jgi:predicted nucleic acid-binding protein